jgi:hypothetical protein
VLFRLSTLPTYAHSSSLPVWLRRYFVKCDQMSSCTSSVIVGCSVQYLSWPISDRIWYRTRDEVLLHQQRDVVLHCILGLLYSALFEARSQKLTRNPATRQLWKCTLSQILGLELRIGNLHLTQNTMRISPSWANNTGPSGIKYLVRYQNKLFPNQDSKYDVQTF